MKGATLLGLDRFRANLRSYSNAMKADVQRAATETANIIAESAKRSIVETETSSPGGPPANRTGNLVRSIKVRTKGEEVEVRAEADYAAQLEFLKERPFLFPAFEANKDELEKKIKEYHNLNATRLVP